MVNLCIMLIRSNFRSDAFSQQSSIKLRLASLFVGSRCLLVRIRGGIFSNLESRAEAHIVVVTDVVVVEAVVVEVRVPRAVQVALRRRPVAVREAFTRVVRGRYV